MIENKSKENSKNQILDAALKVFVKKGYSQTRMDDIVEISGLSKGAIYHHYESKKDLFLSLIEHWENYFFPDVFNKNINEKSPDDILRDIVKDVINTFNHRKYVFLAELEFWSLANHDEKVRDRTKALYVKLLQLFRSVIIKGIESNHYKKINVDVAALSVMTALQGVIWFSIFEDSKLSAEEYLNDVIEFIIHGFKK